MYLNVLGFKNLVIRRSKKKRDIFAFKDSTPLAAQKHREHFDRWLLLRHGAFQQLDQIRALRMRK